MHSKLKIIIYNIADNFKKLVYEGCENQAVEAAEKISSAVVYAPYVRKCPLLSLHFAA